jgi:serine/threonine-protein kinase
VTDSFEDRIHARVGKTLKDKWRIDRLIGVGGMAAVYACTHRNGNTVAVKVLHPEMSANKEARTRFLREGYAANKVKHPGAVVVLDDDVDEDGSVFLVMELLEGEALADLWERTNGKVSVEQILLVAYQLLDVLAAAHDKTILHRDIKPDNIFLLESGGVKLLDFGLARLRELSAQSNATRQGHTMGTPAYMAPEQARARWEEVDARTDLWALGATMFKLLAGRSVHEAPTVNEQLLAAMTQPAPRLASMVPGVPAVVAAVVDRALEFHKKDRWPDARRMQQAVYTAYEELTGRPPNETHQPRQGKSSDAIALAPTIEVESGSLGSATTKVFRPKARVWRWLVPVICLAAAVYLFLKNGKRIASWVTATAKGSFPGVAASANEPPRPAGAIASANERTRSDSPAGALASAKERPRSVPRSKPASSR